MEVRHSNCVTGQAEALVPVDRCQPAALGAGEEGTRRDRAGRFAWLSAFVESTDEAWQARYDAGLATPDDRNRMEEDFGGWIGMRHGITAAGDWIYSVGGDYRPHGAHSHDYPTTLHRRTEAKPPIAAGVSPPGREHYALVRPFGRPDRNHGYVRRPERGGIPGYAVVWGEHASVATPMHPPPDEGRIGAH